MFSQSIESIFETLKNVNDVIHMISIPPGILDFSILGKIYCEEF